MGIDPRNFTPEQLHNLIMSTDDGDAMLAGSTEVRNELI